jgi:hypothetical protein
MFQFVIRLFALGIVARQQYIAVSYSGGEDVVEKSAYGSWEPKDKK